MIVEALQNVYVASAAGFAFSLLVGFWATRRLMLSLWESVLSQPTEGSQKHINPHPEIPQLVGMVERVLYTASWRAGKPEFIGIWLVLKAAGNWSGWANDDLLTKGKLLGRTVFNVNLIGTAFSLAYGVIGGMMIDCFMTARWTAGVTLPLALMAGTFAAIVFARRMRKQVAA